MVRFTISKCCAHNYPIYAERERVRRSRPGCFGVEIDRWYIADVAESQTRAADCDDGFLLSILLVTTEWV